MIRIVAAFVATLFVAAPAIAAQPTMGEGGIYHHDWFKESFLDVAEDIAEAAEEGKHLVIAVEQVGCIYCKKMQTEYLADDKLAAYINENFQFVQLNMWGSREVTDTDGEAMEEKDVVARWRILHTPTLVFFPMDAAKAKGKKGVDAAALVVPGAGAYSKNYFKWSFDFIKEKRYEKGQHFQKYLVEKIAAMRAAEGK